MNHRLGCKQQVSVAWVSVVLLGMAQTGNTKGHDFANNSGPLITFDLVFCMQ
jgi:hypothetical protein